MKIYLCSLRGTLWNLVSRPRSASRSSSFPLASFRDFQIWLRNTHSERFFYCVFFGKKRRVVQTIALAITTRYDIRHIKDYGNSLLERSVSRENLVSARI